MNNLKCPECFQNIKPEFNYCPYCKSKLKNDDIYNTLDDLKTAGSIIIEPDTITSAQLDRIFKIFQKHANDNSNHAHLLEEKICHKFIRDISNSNYSIKDIAEISKKILNLIRLPYSRAY